LLQKQKTERFLSLHLSYCRIVFATWPVKKNKKQKTKSLLMALVIFSSIFLNCTSNKWYWFFPSFSRYYLQELANILPIVYSHVCLSLYISVCLSLCLSLSLSVSLSVCLSLCLFSLSLCLSRFFLFRKLFC
jgi:hypothetical protein